MNEDINVGIDITIWYARVSPGVPQMGHWNPPRDLGVPTGDFIV